MSHLPGNTHTYKWSLPSGKLLHLVSPHPNTGLEIGTDPHSSPGPHSPWLSYCKSLSVVETKSKKGRQEMRSEVCSKKRNVRSSL